MVETLETNNPTKDGSLGLVFSEFYLLTISGRSVTVAHLSFQIKGGVQFDPSAHYIY
jgi:hypothetical protein